MNKPLEDIMVQYSYCDIIMFNSYDHAAFIDFKFISGLNLVISKELCIGMADILSKAAAIVPSRIYINFFEVSGVHAWRFINGTPVCSVKKL
ncbi:hypothetical protein [Pseudobacteroides cellulosolvens]|uniref:Uncharacterized protein n=1 Tax=Pseudobacteroides cellulosolvens ATCC 35603 = DSM 2933 TaxID=398512 RepID=A0A0L6JNN7_9FIRM|nr:hypothetical protein [Pseudobacteroides cellulosolvens]KNY27379.1 hypothetical protein Bccel_2650 [Pseudobacteroides cellulosolvens ATCC 35603 = DSM 2933]